MSELVKFMSFSSKEEEELVKNAIDEGIIKTKELVDKVNYYILRYINEKRIRECDRKEIAQKLKEWGFVNGKHGYGQAYYRIKKLCKFKLLKTIRVEPAKTTNPKGGGRKKEIFTLNITSAACSKILEQISEYIKKQIIVVEKGKTEVNEF
jgi:hypothetical protein